MSLAVQSPLIASLYVAAGGAAGAAARYLLGDAITRWTGSAGGFAWATLSINVLGSLVMGLLFGWLARHGGGAENLRLLLGVGLLGGFTTFSAFSLEIVLLLQRGAFGAAALYITASVLGGVAALMLGLTIMGEPA